MRRSCERNAASATSFSSASAKNKQKRRKRNISFELSIKIARAFVRSFVRPFVRSSVRPFVKKRQSRHRAQPRDARQRAAKVPRGVKAIEVVRARLLYAVFLPLLSSRCYCQFLSPSLPRSSRICVALIANKRALNTIDR